MAGSKYSPELVAHALRESHGLITHAASRMGCSRRTIHSYIDRFPVVRQALEDAREGFVDDAESKLMDQVESGDPRAVMFVLKTLGKSRGYVERVEQATLTDRQVDELIESELAKRTETFRIAASDMTDAELEAIVKLGERKGML